MDNSYFIAFCIILSLAFIFIVFINKNYLQTQYLNTETKLLGETGSLDVATNAEKEKIL